ncbi:MAG TPA: response regulator transcription factor, partial [Actinomycetota bacterium]
MVRVVFAEDNYLVREGTAALLGSVDGVELVGTAETMDELLAAVEEHRPQAVLTDIRMPPTNSSEGIEAAKRIRSSHPEIGVVVLSQFAEEAYAFDLLKDGAAGLGYLLKERVADVDELVRALNEVARGGSVLDPRVVEALVAAKDRMAHSPLATLTDRER